MTSASVMIVESDAAWPASELEHAEVDADCVVVAQQTGEPELVFAKRTISRIRALTAAGTSVRLGVISVGRSRSAVATDSRYRIARALLSARRDRQPTELALVALETARPRHDLMALAGALCELLAGDSAVRVKLLPRSALDVELPSGRAA